MAKLRLPSTKRVKIKMSKIDLFDITQKKLKEVTKERLLEAAEVLKDKMVDNASLVDHTLKDLADMGHPYSVQNPANPHSPPYLIHMQTGNLVDNIEIVKKLKHGFFSPYVRISVGVDESKVPYISSLIFGNRRMIARDFITGSYDEVLPEMKRIVRGKIV